MECRRLIKFGRASYVVSLPKKWVRSHSLKKGDLIFLDESGEKILLSPTINKVNSAKKITIGCEKKHAAQISSELTSAYLNNYDQIRLVGNLGEHEIGIKSLIAFLPGLEIIEQSENNLVAKDLLDRSEVTLTPILRRMDMIIRSMLDDARQGIDVFEQDVEVNRLVFLSKRVLRSALDDPGVARSLGFNEMSLLKHWTMINYLESVGDEVKRLSRLLRGTGRDVVEVYSVLMKSYQRVMKAHHTPVLEPARQVELETKQRSALCAGLLEKDPQNALVVYHLRALSATIKNMARLLLDFSAKEDLPEPISVMQALEKETGFLKATY